MGGASGLQGPPPHPPCLGEVGISAVGGRGTSVAIWLSCSGSPEETKPRKIKGLELPEDRKQELIVRSSETDLKKKSLCTINFFQKLFFANLSV